MKKFLNQSFAIATLVAIAFFANIVSANPVVSPPLPAPQNNTALPIDVNSNQVIKGDPTSSTGGGLGVGTFEATMDAQFEKSVYFNGLLLGKPITTLNSTLAIGSGVKKVDLATTGSLTTRGYADDDPKNGLYSDQIKAPAGTLKPVCANNNGDIILCASAAILPQCSDGIDNADPEDTLIDQADPGCHSDGDATNPASYVPSDNDETDVPKVISGTMIYTCPENNLGQRYAHLDLTFDKPLPAPTKLVFAECSDGAGGYYAKVCEGVRIIPGGLPSGYVDASGNNFDYSLPGGWGPWTINIPAGSTSWSSPGTATVPTIWNGDYYPLPGSGELDCESNLYKDERTTVPDQAYLKLISPTPGWTLMFTGIDHQPDPAKTWTFPVYPVY